MGFLEKNKNAELNDRKASEKWMADQLKKTEKKRLEEERLQKEKEGKLAQEEELKIQMRGRDFPCPLRLLPQTSKPLSEVLGNQSTTVKKEE